MKEKKLLYYPGLTVSIFVAHYFSTFLEEMVVAGNNFAWIYLFFWYMAFLIAADKILKHYKIR